MQKPTVVSWIAVGLSLVTMIGGFTFTVWTSAASFADIKTEIELLKYKVDTATQDQYRGLDATRDWNAQDKVDSAQHKLIEKLEAELIDLKQRTRELEMK
jgi:hypothetical protein